MLVEATGSSANVTGAIRQAAQQTGADFGYLLATAKVESRLNPAAAAPTSSASGLYQFIDQTWLATMHQAGPAFGYGKYAAAITRRESGSYSVSDPALRREILDLRKDPTANALMAGVFTRQNAAKLGNQLGRAASEGELYIAHFLGPTGATRLISAAAERPGTRAADLFPAGARANRSIFYDKAGNARSVTQVYDALVSRYQVARAGPSDPVAAARQAVGPSPIMSALAANPAAPSKEVIETGPVFHSLFRTGERREAVAPAINALWTGQGAPISPPKPNESVASAFDALAPARPNMRALFSTGS